MKLLPQMEIQFESPRPLPGDVARMGRQRADVWQAMLVGGWWTLGALEEATGHPQASISARLRDFRRPQFGGHRVERRRKREGMGTWEYRLTPSEGA